MMYLVSSVDYKAQFFRKRIEGSEHWLDEDIGSLFDDVIAKDIQEVIMHPILFYRFSNGLRVWDIREESFTEFSNHGIIKVWQEKSMFPKPGEVRRWLESVTSS